MISASNLTMRFGGKILFKNADMQLNPGQHYGLIGANGSGKSTLIKLLAGDLTPEAGNLSTPTQFVIGTLKQDHFLYEECPILDVVLMGRTKLWNALQARKLLLEREEFNEKECHDLDDLEKIINSQHGYAASSQAAKLLEGLGLLAATHPQPMKTLSGGYKLRVLLAQVLFSNPDILLLDEPTNHLDIFSIQWLAGYLKNFPGTLLISSHDRSFLNNVCNHIVDIDCEKIKIYKGDFDTFEFTKARDREQQESLLAKQDKKREDMQEFIDRFGAKASKARQAQSRMRFVEKLKDEMDANELSPSSRMHPHLYFAQCRPAGAVPLIVNGISKSYGANQVLKEISFEVERGERVAILGANGVGKSTLLEILTNSTPMDGGNFTWGYAAQYAYFPQDHARHVQGAPNLLEWLRQFDRQATDEQLRRILGQVLFSGDDVEKPLHVLSGGEAARLLLAKMMLLKHNILIFDEPTNHLDIEATDALMEALQNYDGTLLFVSHNRHFVTHIANRIIEITPQHGLVDFRCTFEEYLAKREFDLLSATSQIRKEQRDNTQTKAGYEEQKNQKKIRSQLEKKVSAVEEKCHQIEQKILKIDARLSEEGFYQSVPQPEQQLILKQKSELESALATAMQEWEEASHALSDNQ
jgi:ATPase subunit of ABC transporter with duplicated ATPase domains